MSRRDLHHYAVVHALEKDRWLITDDPLTLEFAGKLIGIDLAAEKLLAAERDNRTIAVEIKSFQGSSDVSEFHIALGQFLNYRHVLAKAMLERTLYLAVPQETFGEFFQETDILEILQVYQVKLLIYDSMNEEIVQWIE
jgi:hypothetical protein